MDEEREKVKDYMRDGQSERTEVDGKRDTKLDDRKKRQTTRHEGNQAIQGER